MNSNLDIWAVQEDGSEIFTALDQIKSGVSIIYDNCVCNMSIGSNVIHCREFNTVIYNEESDVIILVMKTSSATKEDAIRYLSEKNLPFVEVTFMEQEDRNDELDVPIIWFAREAYVLEDAIKDSVEKGEQSCTYYPIIKGDLKLNYINNNFAPEQVDGRLFRGLISFEDKIILLVSQKENVDENGNSRNVTKDAVLELLDKYGITPNFDYDDDITFKKKKTGPSL